VLDGVRISAPHQVEAAERCDKHEQSRARQVEIGQHRVDRAEAIARRDEQRRLAAIGRERAVFGRGALDQPLQGLGLGDRAEYLASFDETCHALQESLSSTSSGSLVSVHQFAELVCDLVEHARVMDALGKAPGLQQALIQMLKVAINLASSYPRLNSNPTLRERFVEIRQLLVRNTPSIHAQRHVSVSRTTVQAAVKRMSDATEPPNHNVLEQLGDDRAALEKAGRFF